MCKRSISSETRFYLMVSGHKLPYGAKFCQGKIKIDEFPAIRQYFPHQNFLLIWLLIADEIVVIQLNQLHQK